LILIVFIVSLLVSGLVWFSRPPAARVAAGKVRSDELRILAVFIACAKNDRRSVPPIAHDRCGGWGKLPALDQGQLFEPLLPYQRLAGRPPF
jgi:hypothetical protein